MSDLAPFTRDFTPTLKTREMIKATVCFFVEGRTWSYALAIWLNGNIDSAEEDIRQRIFADADSVTNRWGLQFPSADAAVDLSSYASLAHDLMAIASSDFTIKKVVVRDIIPLSERVKIESPKPIRPSFTEQVLSYIDEVVPALEAVEQKEETLKRTKPDLWNHPILGGITTSSPNSTTRMPEQKKGNLGRMLDDMKNDIMQYRRPR